MDIDRRKRTFLRQIMSLLLCSLLFLLFRVPTSLSSTLYFTNNNRDIDRLENNVITSIIQAESSLLALDCNSCDDRIYWTNGKEIKRSFTNTSNSTESVLDFGGVARPTGVAVDWRGGNVYFTDQIDDNYGSVEVVTCNGKYRRVLFRNSYIIYKNAGPIAVDSHHGYIFFADMECCIWRANMNGSDPVRIINIVINKINDLAVDYDNSVLYWVDNGTIYNSDYNGNNHSSISKSVTDSSEPFGISIINGVLYWTQKETALVTGAIYSFALHSDVISAAIISNNNGSINPNDVSAFISKEVIASVTGGCSHQNGDCSHFCFTVPNTTDSLYISSSVQCACRTGFTLNNDGKTCIEVPLKFLLVAVDKYINMLSYDIPNEDYLLPLPIKSSGDIDYIAYDRKNHLIYWTQRDPPAIWQSEFNGDNQKAIITESISLPEGLVLSDEGTILYWSDSSLDKIEVVSLFDRNKDPLPRRTIINTGLDHPIGLAINESIGYIYWTDFGSKSEGLVKKSSKTGLNRSDVYTNNNLPGPITVDSMTGDVYWADSHPDKLGVYRLKKGIANNLFSLTSQRVSGLSVLDTTLYWTDRREGRIYSKPLDTVDVESIVADDLGEVADITSVNSELDLVDTDCSTNNGQCEDICVVSSDGTGHTCLCRDHYKLMGDTQCVEEEPATIILSTNTCVSIISVNDRTIVGTLPIVARAMDYYNHTLYWIGLNDGVIYSSDIVHSSPNITSYQINTVAACCYGKIEDLAVDWWGNNLYWTDGTTGIIWVAKLNGTNKHVLLKGLTSLTHLVLNPYKSLLYFVEDHKIYSIPMNGDGPITSVTEVQDTIADLTIDLVRPALYFSSSNSLYHYDLSGNTNPLSVWSPSRGNPKRLIHFEDKVYTYFEEEDAFVYSYDILQSVGNDKVPEFSVSSQVPNQPASELLSMTLIHYSRQPDVHWCTTITNGECVGDPAPLCLVTDHYYRQCRCESTNFLQAEYDNEREVCRYMCIKTPSFLLLSTNKEVYYLSLRVPNNTAGSNTGCTSSEPLPNELPLGYMGNIQAISYDPFSDRIFWIDGTSDTINSINMTGNDSFVLGEYDKFNVASMGYDWRGGTVVWTEDFSTRISGVAHDGRGDAGVLYKYSFSPAQFWESSKIAVDSNNGVLYWSKSSDFSLNKLDLATKVSTRVDTGSKKHRLQIKLLTFEPENNILFWYNSYNNTIEGFNISKTVVTIIASVNPNDTITAMATTTVNNDVCLFWYNQSDWSVYYYNMASKSVNIYRKLEQYTNIISMAAHNTNGFSTKVNEPCYNTNNSLDFCSHYCSVSDDTQSCFCPLHRTLLDNKLDCSDLQCGNLLSCSDNSSCYNISSHCDGIKDCDDASDESNCDDYCEIGRTLCDPENHLTGCIPLDSLCKDSNNHCAAHQDNCSCDDSGFFECQSNCFPNRFKCDDKFDCNNGSDEANCKVTLTTSSTSSSSSSMSPPSTPINESNAVFNSLIITIISVVGIIALIIGIGICVVTMHCLITRKTKDYDMRHDVFSGKATCSSSPRPSSDIGSIGNSDLSINTMVTGSTNVDKTSQEARVISLKRLSTLSTDPSNPPNSPITIHHSVAFTDDEVTMFSEFDHPIPPAPNPSLDYDVISEGISSVSQRKYPGVLPLNNIPTIDERHSESPPPPYYNHQTDNMYGDEDSIDTAYKDFCPPIVHPSLRYFNDVHLDDISETTFSMTVNDDNYYNCNGYLPSDEPRSLVVEDRQDGHREEHFMHPYDRPPPPSPVTEYSLHGD